MRGENEAVLELRFTWFLGQFIPFYTDRNHSEKFQDVKLSRKKFTLFILQLTVPAGQQHVADEPAATHDDA